MGNKMTSPIACITCGKFAYIRGLCSHCYDKIRKAIKSGQTTEQQAIADGKMLPKQNTSSWWLGPVDRKVRSLKRE